MGKTIILWFDLIFFSLPSQKDTYSLYLQRRTRPSFWLLLAGPKECRITPPSLGSSLFPKGWRLTWCLLTSASPNAATATPTSGCRESAVGRRTTAAERTRRPRVRSSSPRASTSTCPTVCPRVEASAPSPRSPCRRASVSGHLSGLFEGLRVNLNKCGLDVFLDHRDIIYHWVWSTFHWVWLKDHRLHFVFYLLQTCIKKLLWVWVGALDRVVFPEVLCHIDCSSLAKISDLVCSNLCVLWTTSHQDLVHFSPSAHMGKFFPVSCLLLVIQSGP